MKWFILSTLLVVASLSEAAKNRAIDRTGESDFVCRSEATANHPVVQIRLKQLNRGEVREGVKTPFQMEVAVLKHGTNVPMYRPVVYVGHVETEDVMFNFMSAEQSASLNIYLDELDQTTLYIKGQHKVHMDCAELRW